MLEASGHLSRMATRGVLHTVSSEGVGSSVGTGISVGEENAMGEDLGDRGSAIRIKVVFFLGDRASAELWLDSETGDGGDGGDDGAETGLHRSRLPVSLTAFLLRGGVERRGGGVSDRGSCGGGGGRDGAGGGSGSSVKFLGLRLQAAAFGQYLRPFVLSEMCMGPAAFGQW